jgi:hypothetical protein
MKKAIGIIILGLLLSGCTTDDKLVSSGKIYIGMTKQSLCSNLHSSAYPGEDACLRGFATNRYLRDLNKEILWGENKTIYYVFDNVTTPWTNGLRPGNGILKGFYSNEEEALIAAGYYAEKKRKKAEEGKKAKKREEERKKEAKKREEEKKKKKAAG